MTRFKRGKPENYLYQLAQMWLSRYRLGAPDLIHASQLWALRRSIPVIARLQEELDE